MTSTRLIPLALTIAVVATACGPSEPEVTETVTSSSGTTASPTATAEPPPSATPPAKPMLDELTVSTEGLPPLTIGEPPESNPGAKMIRFEEDYCYNEEIGITEGDLDRWVADYEDVTGRFDTPTAPFMLSADDDAVSRIDIFGTDIATDSGISIGSTLDEVEQAYPELEHGESTGISSVHWVEGERGYLVFETQGESNDLAEEGEPDTVILIRVLDASLDPDFTAASTDNVAGGCI